MNAIPRFDQRLKQFEHKSSPRPCEEALDVFKYERSRSNSSNQMTELSDERIPFVIGSPHPGRRESLTRRPTRNDRWLGDRQLASDVRVVNMIGQVRSVCFNGTSPVVVRRNALEACSLKSKRQSAGTAEQVNKRQRHWNDFHHKTARPQLSRREISEQVPQRRVAEIPRTPQQPRQLRPHVRVSRTALAVGRSCRVRRVESDWKLIGVERHFAGGGVLVSGQPANLLLLLSFAVSCSQVAFHEVRA
jgi:hypothetical protein